MRAYIKIILFPIIIAIVLSLPFKLQSYQLKSFANLLETITDEQVLQVVHQYQRLEPAIEYCHQFDCEEHEANSFSSISVETKNGVLFYKVTPFQVFFYFLLYILLNIFLLKREKKQKAYLKRVHKMEEERNLYRRFYHDIQLPLSIMDEHESVCGVVDSFRKFQSNQELKVFHQLEKVLKEVSSLIQLKASHISIKIDGDLDQVVFFEGDLSRSLLNLFNNSFEAGASDVQVYVKVNKSECELTISDNGGGIPLDTLNSLESGRFSSKSNGLGEGITQLRNNLGHSGGCLEVRNNQEGVVFKLKTLLAASLNIQHVEDDLLMQFLWKEKFEALQVPLTQHSDTSELERLLPNSQCLLFLDKYLGDEAISNDMLARIKKLGHRVYLASGDNQQGENYPNVGKALPFY